MIREGQVRRWRYPGGIRGEGTEIFIVVRRMEMGAPRDLPSSSETLMDHWDIVCGGQVMQGWASRTLETESDLVSE